MFCAATSSPANGAGSALASLEAEVMSLRAKDLTFDSMAYDLAYDLACDPLQDAQFALPGRKLGGE